MKIREAFRQSIVAIVCYTLAFQPLIAAAEGIKGVGSASVNPGIGQTSYGVPLINITKPSAAGVSKNQYIDFNVSHYGAVFNNSTKGTQTILGGEIRANSNLQNIPAKIILNEVRGSNTSQLNGYMEVGGAAADLVVANPSGITCNGCGFVNTPNATLTTGVANIVDGQIKGYDVNKGNIKITGKGLDASNINKLDIISRTLELNAKVQANKLNVSLGKNAQNQKKLAEDAPKVLLDATALGGMYANQINLVGTEKGVGVNLPNEVYAGSGGVEITADGSLLVRQVGSAGKVELASQSGNIKFQDQSVYSSKNINVKAAKAISLDKNARVISKAKSSYTAANLVNKGSILSGLDENGGFNTRGKLHISVANSLKNTGQIVSTSDSLISANAFENAEKATVGSFGGQKINSTTLHNNGSFEALANLALESDYLLNKGKIASGKSLAVKATELQNLKGSLSGADQLLIDAAKAFNIEGTVVAKNIKIKGDEFANKKGRVIATNTVNLASKQSTNTSDNGLKLATESNAPVTVSIIAAGNAINIESPEFNNEDSTSIIVAADTVSLKEGTLLSNDGVVLAKKVKSGTFQNRVSGDQSLPMDKLLSTIDGSISKGKALISAENIDLSKADIHSGNMLEIKADKSLSVSNIDSEKSLLLIAGETISTANDSTLKSAQKIHLYSGNSVNTDGSSISATDALLVSEKIVSGNLTTSNATSLIGSDSVTTTGQIKSGGNLEVIGTDEIVLADSIEANKIQLLTDGKLTTKNITGRSDVVLVSKQGINTIGLITSADKLSLSSTDTITVSGAITSASDAVISTDKSLNLKSGVSSGGLLALVSADHVTVGGQVYSKADQLVLADGNISLGKSISGSNTHLAAKGYLTVSGIVSGAKDVTLGAGKHAYLKDNVYAADNLLAVIDGNAYFYGYSRAGRGNVTLHGNNYLYQKGAVSAGKDVGLSSNGYVSAYNRVSSGKDLAISAGKNVYVKDYTYSKGDQNVFAKNSITLGRALGASNVTLSAGDYATIGTQGTSYAGKGFTLSAGKTASVRDHISAGKDLTIAAKDHVYLYKNSSSSGNTTLLSGLNTWSGGQVYSKGDQFVVADGNISLGKSISGSNTHLAAKGYLTVSGIVSGARDVTLGAGKHAYLKDNVYAADNLLAVIDGNAYFYGYSRAGRGNVTLHGNNYLYQKGAVSAGKDVGLSSNGYVSAYNRVSSGKDLVISAGKNVYVKDYTYSKGDQNVFAKNSIHLGRALGASNVTLSAGDYATIGTQGTSYAGKGFTLSAGKTASVRDHISAGKDLTIAAKDHVYLYKNSSSSGNTTLLSGLNTWSGGQVYSKGDQFVVADGNISLGKSISGSNTHLAAKGYLTVSGIVSGARDVTLGAGKHAYLKDNVYAADNLLAVIDGNAYFYGYSRAGRGNVTLHGNNYLYQKGAVSAGKDVGLSSNGYVSAYNRVSSGKDLVISAGKNVYVKDYTYSKGDQNVFAKNSITLGRALGASNVTLSAGDYATIGTQGTSYANKEFTLSAGKTASVRDHISAGKDLTIAAKDHVYLYKNSSSSGNTTLLSGLNTWSGGQVYSKGDQLVLADGNISLGKSISGSNTHLSAKGYLTVSGIVSGARDVTLGAGKNVYVKDYTYSKGDQNVFAKNSIHLGRALGASNVTLSAGDYATIGTQGTSYANKEFTLSAGKTASVRDHISAGKDLTIAAKDHVYLYKNSSSSGNTTLLSGLNTWSGGQVYSKGDQFVVADGNISLGKSISGSNTHLAAKGYLTVSGIVSGAKDVTLGAGKHAYLKDNVYAADNLLAVIDGNAYFYGYSRAGRGNVTLHGNNYLYQKGAVSAAKDVALSSNGYVSAYNRVSSGKDLVISAGKNVYVAGNSVSGRDFSVAAGNDVRLNHASIAALKNNRNITLKAGNRLLIPISTMSAKGSLHLSTGENLDLDKVSANNDLTLVSKKSVNLKTSALANKNIVISAAKDFNTAGKVRAGNDLSIAAKGNINLKTTVTKKAWNKTSHKNTAVTGYYNVKVRVYVGRGNYEYRNVRRYGTYYPNITTSINHTGSSSSTVGADLDARYGDIKLYSDKNINATGATIDAKKSIGLIAKGDIVLRDGVDSYNYKAKITTTKIITDRRENRSGVYVTRRAEITSNTNSHDKKTHKATSLNAGQNILLSSKSNILLRSKLNAKKDVVVQARNNILVQDVDDLSKDVSVIASVVKNNAISKQAAIKTGGNLSVNAERGSVYLGEQKHQVIAGDTDKTIVELRSGRDLNIYAGTDILATASDTYAAHDTTLSAARDVTIKAVQTLNTRNRSGGRSHGHWRDTSTQVRQTVANLRSVNDLTIKAGRDLTTLGSILTAYRGNTGLYATRDVNLYDVQNADTYDYYSKWRGGRWGQGRKRVETRHTVKVSNMGTRVNAGKNISINAVRQANNKLAVIKSRNVNVVGANINAKKDIDIFSGANTRLVSGLEFTDSNYHRVTSGYFGVKRLGGGSDTQNISKEYLGHIEMKSGGDTTLLSSGDVGILAGKIDARNINIAAGIGDNSARTASINILGDTQTKKLYEKKVRHRIGLDYSDNMLSLASTTKDIKIKVDSLYKGSKLKAQKDITLQAKTDINVVGSSLTAANNIALAAGNDVNLLAAADLSSSRDEHHQSRIGIGIKLGGSEAAVWAGVRSIKDIIADSASLNKGTELIAGNGILVTAGNNLNKVGSYIMAGGNIFQGAGNSINEIAGVNKRQHYAYQRRLEAGIKAGIKAKGAAATAINAATRATSAQSDKLKVAKAYQAYQAGTAAYKQLQEGALKELNSPADIKDAVSNGADTNSYSAGVSAFVDYTQTKSNSTHNNGVANTTLSGGNITLKAGNKLNLHGSQISAVGELKLNASDIKLSSIQHRTDSRSKTTTASGEVTVIGTAGASLAASKANTYKNSVSHQLARLSANNVSIGANNLSITGGKILANAIQATVANNLTIESVQDSASHRQKNSAVSVSVGASNSAAANKNTVESDRQAVSEQSGLYASESIDLSVGNNTRLLGSVIHADAKNGVSLKSKTLQYLNLKNKDRIKASGVGISTEGISIANPVSDEQENITFAAISSGTITSESDTSGLSRDTRNAFNPLDKVKSVIEIQEQQELAGIIAEEGFKQVGHIASVKATKDSAWADGGWKKSLAHTLMGAVVASVAGGDIALGGLTAGAREALSGLSPDGKRTFLQQLVSTTIGAVVGGEAGAAIALQGEKFNRQLHQKEIDTIKTIAREKCANDSACISEWTQKLTQQALRQVDAIWAIGLGATDEEAAQILSDNAGQFTDAKGNTQQLFSADSYAKNNAALYAEFNKFNTDIYAQAVKDFDVKKGLDTIKNKVEQLANLSPEEKKNMLQTLADAIASGVEKSNNMSASDAAKAAVSYLLEAIGDTANTVAGTLATATTSTHTLSEIYGISTEDAAEIKLIVGMVAAATVIDRRTGGVAGEVAKGLADPKTIRFSQDSIKGTFKDGRSVQDLVAGLKNGSIKASDVPAIRTVERNGQLISIDNRRLAAFREAGVPIRITPATAADIAKAQRLGKFSAGYSGGDTIRIRGQ